MGVLFHIDSENFSISEFLIAWVWWNSVSSKYNMCLKLPSLRPKNEFEENERQKCQSVDFLCEQYQNGVPTCGTDCFLQFPKNRMRITKHRKFVIERVVEFEENEGLGTWIWGNLSWRDFKKLRKRAQMSITEIPDLQFIIYFVSAMYFITTWRKYNRPLLLLVLQEILLYFNRKINFPHNISEIQWIWGNVAQNLIFLNLKFYNNPRRSYVAAANWNIHVCNIYEGTTK